MTDLIARRHLFGNPVRAGYQISPDGRHLAWLAPVEGVLNVWVGPIDDPDSGGAVTQDRRRGISLFAFAYDGRHLVYVQDADGDENNHVYAVDIEAGTTRDLTPIDGVAAYVAGISRIVRDKILVALNDRDPSYHDLHTIELATGERRLVRENPDFAGFVTDDQFQVRLAGRNHPDGSSEYLTPDGEDWRPWTRYPAEDARVSGAGHVDAEGRVVFCRDSRGRDTAALTRVDLASGDSTVLAADDGADIGETILDAQTHEPLAYCVDRERRVWHALDDEVAKDIAFLDAQRIGDWTVASRSEDDRLWIVTADGDVSPATTYVYDRSAATLRSLGSARPALKDAPLAPMQALTIAARDGLELISYLTRPLGVGDEPGPLVLLVHGGPWARDHFGYNAQHQWLANRGYAALSINFRSSTGFGKSFLNAGDGEWGRRMDDDLLDAVAYAVAEGIADPSRIAIMGGSYGGYATLAALVRNPGTYACGVDIVGPSNLETLLATIPPYWEAARAQLTRAIGDPGTPDGAALVRERSPVHSADRIRTPLMIVQGANDPRVKQAESDQMAAAMTANGVPVTYLLFPDEGHGFVRPQNRLAFYAKAEAFLAKHLGGRAEPDDPAETAGTTLQVVRDDPVLNHPTSSS